MVFYVSSIVVENFYQVHRHSTNCNSEERIREKVKKTSKKKQFHFEWYFWLECVWPAWENSLQQKSISDFQYFLMSTSTYINSFYFYISKKYCFFNTYTAGAKCFWKFSLVSLKTSDEYYECKRFSSSLRTVNEFEKPTSAKPKKKRW